MLRLKEFHLPLLVALLLMSLYPLQNTTRRLLAQEEATFTLPDGSLSLVLPAGWLAEDHGDAIRLTNNEDLLEVNRPPLGEGDVLVQIFGTHESNRLGIEEAAGPAEALALFVEEAGPQNFGPVQVLGDEPAAATVLGEAETLQQHFLAVEKADAIITLAALARPADAEAAANVLQELARSLVYEPEQVDSLPRRVLLEPFLGPEDAPLTIYEYSSYGCPSCREHYQDGTTEEIIGWTEFNEFEGQVRFVFRNFPVIIPQTDPIGAEVAQCVLDIGQDAFWDYHFTLYEMSDEDYYALNSADDFVEVAANLGYDGDSLGECYASRTHRGAVNYQASRAREAPAYGTPSYFLNDERVGTVRGFEALIRYQLEQLGE